MDKRILLWIVLIVMVFSSSMAVFAQPQQDYFEDGNQQILILVGPQYGIPIGNTITSAMVDTFLSAGMSLDDIFVEFLDIHRIAGDQHRSNLLISLQNKLTDKNIGLIIAVNQGAVEFVAQEGHNLFPDAPMLIPIFEKEPDWTGEPRRLITLTSLQDAEGTLRHALSLFPRTQQVVIIMGKCDCHAPFYDVVHKALDELPEELEIEDTSNLAYEEMLQHVSSLPGDTIALYGSYFEDISGRSFIPAEVAAQIAVTANVPVFALRDMHIYSGLVGGSIIHTNKLGNQAAETGLDYLNGKIQLSQQTTNIEVANVLLFDWQQLKQWDADPGVLPEETIFFNYTPTLWESHRELILVTCLFIVVLIFLVVLLFITNRKQKITLERLHESECELLKNKEYLNNLIRYANAPIITWSPDFKITEFNRAFKKLTGRIREEVVGQHLEILFPDDSRLESMNHISRTVAGELLEVIDIPILHISGKVHSVLWNSANIKNSEGKLIATIAQGQDITERKKSEEDLINAYDATIKGWGYAVDLKDKETENHSQRVTSLTLHIAKKLDLKEKDLVHIRRGALLHDIGKMGIPDSILLKPGKLTDEEWEIMHKHPVYAFEMLSSIDYLRPALDIPYCHHEKWDGSGYPRGLKKEQIPLAARIFAVVDVYDALTSDRPYRKAWTREKALEYIQEQSGKHFDPQVVDVFVKEIDELDK